MAAPLRRRLDARIEFKKLQELYAASPTQSTYNALVTGETGTGKSLMARTCRTPVHMDSFDPGGTKGLRDMIARGDLVADIKYESENPLQPTMFREWIRDFTARRDGGYFESFGTYILDSSTMWSDAIMNDVLLKAGRHGTAPLFTKDYTPQKIEIQKYIKQILELPCDVIVTGHLKALTDEDGNVTKWRYMTTGQGAVIIPLLFDEIYVTISRERAKGIEYRLLTASTGLHSAKTRMGREVFATYEEPDIRKLLVKANWPSKNKPPLYGGEGENDAGEIAREQEKAAV